MLEKIKKNWNEWYSHSLGMTILAICVVLNGYIEVSFALYGLSVVLLGIGALYNQNKETKAMIIKLIIKSREDIIYERMKDIETEKPKFLTEDELDELLNIANEDRKYEYKKDGATVMLNKAELLNIFMNEETRYINNNRMQRGD